MCVCVCVCATVVVPKCASCVVFKTVVFKVPKVLRHSCHLWGGRPPLWRAAPTPVTSFTLMLQGGTLPVNICHIMKPITLLKRADRIQSTSKKLLGQLGLCLGQNCHKIWSYQWLYLVLSDIQTCYSWTFTKHKCLSLSQHTLSIKYTPWGAFHPLSEH